MTFWMLAFFVSAVSAAAFGPGFQQFPRPVGFSATAKANVAPFVVSNVARSTVQQPVNTFVAKSEANVKSYVDDAVEIKPIKYNTSPVKNVNYGNEADAQTVVAESDVNPEGFVNKYETSNGIKSYSVGTLKNVADSQALVIEGKYEFLTPEGVPVVITYTADENGYQPRGDLLPQAPEIPPAIARSLEYLRTHVKDEVEYAKKY